MSTTENHLRALAIIRALRNHDGEAFLALWPKNNDQELPNVAQALAGWAATLIGVEALAVDMTTDEVLDIYVQQLLENLEEQQP